MRVAGASTEELSKVVGEAVIRLRMGGEDAHYAGGLVDGSKMLKLFGDVATELLIRLDGDEGLFRAYESVEFLAPVKSGDYIEARGRLVSIGNSSRKMEFTAHKVIQSLEGNAPAVGASSTGLAGAVGATSTALSTALLTAPAVSAAEVLDEPVLVCKAIGVCVTPVPFQRFSPGYGAAVETNRTPPQK